MIHPIDLRTPQDTGASSSEDRAATPSEPSPAVSGKAGIPCADDLPTVTHEGVVKLGDLEITVMRLSNGENVIEAEGFHKILDALFNDEGMGG